MAFRTLRRLLSLGVAYRPRPEARPFLERLETQRDDELIVRVTVLDHKESERFFGVPLANRGIQPVWLHLSNISDRAFRLRLASLDPNYYVPLEAAHVNHFRVVGRILVIGLLALYYLPLIILLLLKVRSARAANRQMSAYFEAHGIGWGIIRPGSEVSGFAFTTLDEGTKQVSVRLLSDNDTKEFSFSIRVPGLRVDHGGHRFDELFRTMEAIECGETELRKHLEALPRNTTGRSGKREGDPLNLVAIGDFDAILNGFGARWDETEIISLRSCWRTFKAFSFGSRYRYSPVSALYVAGRSQDFALQRARQTINERLHLRLWLTPLRFQGKPVWIGQVSRDIGVRFTLQTWNLTTHAIDPNVDDARDYVIDDLMESGRVSQVGYVAGVGAAARSAPRRNLTGDPYFTDGQRAVAIFADTRTTPTFLKWA